MDEYLTVDNDGFYIIGAFAFDDTTQAHIEIRTGSYVGKLVGWEIDIEGSEPSGHLRTACDLPERGPAHLLARFGLQHVKDRL